MQLWYVHHKRYGLSRFIFIPFVAISEVTGDRVLHLLVAQHGRFREEELDSEEVEAAEHEGAEEQKDVRGLVTKSLIRIREDGTASGGDGYIE